MLSSTSSHKIEHLFFCVVMALKLINETALSLIVLARGFYIPERTLKRELFCKKKYIGLISVLNNPAFGDTFSARFRSRELVRSDTRQGHRSRRTETHRNGVSARNILAFAFVSVTV